METNELLKEILKWQKIQAKAAVRPLVLSLLDSKEKRKVYELTDGTFTVKQISERAGVATGTISNWWNNWLSEGILYQEGNRYIKVVSIKGLPFKEGGKKR